MAIRRNRVLVGKILLLTVILLLGGLVFLGCTGAIPKGWSGGAIADEALVLGSMEGKLVALDKSSGARLWEIPFEASSSGGGFGCATASTAVAIYGTPAVGDELVYGSGYNGKVYAINSGSGALRWVYPREGNLEPIVGGLVVAHGKVYFGSSDGKVYALDAVTGDKQWEFETGDKIWSTPATDGDSVFIGSFDNKLYALSAADGSQEWEFPTEGAIASTPLVYDNIVYIGSFDRHLYAVDATNGKQIWQFPVGDEADNKPENWFWTKPVVYNNTIYAGNLDGKIYILNAETGYEIVDAIDLGSPVASWPVLVGNSVIVASEAGVIYALDTGDNQIKQLANLEEKIYAPLSASEGTVYIHTSEGELHALDAQSGAKLWSLSLKS